MIFVLATYIDQPSLDRSGRNLSKNMNNAAINKAFLAATDAATKTEVLTNIATHYGITQDQAFGEVTHSEAEHLLDYVTGPIRMATRVLMQRHRLPV